MTITTSAPSLDVGLDLADRLVGVRRVHLVARAVAEARRALGRVAERSVEGGGELRGVRQDPDALVARARRARRGSRRPGRPSCRSVRPGGPRPGPARSRSARYRSSVASLSTSSCWSSTPQWPWSVYSSRHRSAITTWSSPSSSRSARSARCAIPSGFHASEPSASLRSGTPNSMNASTPLLAISDASLRRDSSVCWDCPGIEAIGTGSVMPSFTNSGATRCRGASSVSRINARSAGVRRIRRGRRRRGSFIRMDATAGRARARRRRPGRRPCAGPRPRARAGRARAPRAP